MRRLTRKLQQTIMIIAAVVFIFFTYKVMDTYFQSYENKKLNQQIRETFYADASDLSARRNANITLDAGDGADLKVEAAQHLPESERELIIMDRFMPLLEKNQDVTGWIRVPNTIIDYPIVHTDNNDYYLDHSFEHKKSSAGAIFMDYRNIGDASDRHTIIYGHHMKDGSMFKGLTKYTDPSFMEQNRIITTSTLYEEIEWEIFSVYVTDISFYYIITDFRSNRDYVDFLHTLQDKSLLSHEIELSSSDQILTLSTCTYDFDDARFVIHAKRVNS